MYHLGIHLGHSAWPFFHGVGAVSTGNGFDHRWEKTASSS